MNRFNGRAILNAAGDRRFTRAGLDCIDALARDVEAALGCS